MYADSRMSQERVTYIFATKAAEAAVSIWSLCRGTLLSYNRLGSDCHGSAFVSVQFLSPYASGV